MNPYCNGMRSTANPIFDHEPLFLPVNIEKTYNKNANVKAIPQHVNLKINDNEIQ